MRIKVFFILCFITNLALTTGYPNTKSADNEISAPENTVKCHPIQLNPRASRNPDSLMQIFLFLKNSYSN
ncbi:uncharacterized protein CELE_Y26G10.6 [Caenorhabditis elegans]|uniref:Secreted protein n=1 Tax=Caenorhabditis elegans TaxID=6239 RepID=C1P664_CAEEL|nr:Secreted protein [Caenorhabditis elegans]CAX65083.1 Secreted protein [Caenorhabditis elegans]|eukprot:NP_001256755.1 Uncharacterized protein CELE_Y26G10.6 [Caenorhabditis elegans]